MTDDKYVTFKREDFENWAADLEVAGEASGMPDSLDDTVVIRKQDLFASSGLSAYANAMVAAAESLDVLLAAPDWPIVEHVTEVSAALRRISDHFFEQAEEARDWPTRKVPD